MSLPPSFSILSRIAALEEIEGQVEWVNRFD